MVLESNTMACSDYYLQMVIKKYTFLSINVFSKKVLIGGTIILLHLTGDGIVILRGHPSHVKV